jgi:Flp pilus assembly CpaF family ATPase
LISGGIGTGVDDHSQWSGTRLPGEDWLILIGNRAQLRVDAPGQLRFEVRRAQGDLRAITIRDLLRTSLRHWLDRLLVGEARGRVSVDLLQAMARQPKSSGSVGTIARPTRLTSSR